MLASSALTSAFVIGRGSRSGSRTRTVRRTGCCQAGRADERLMPIRHPSQSVVDPALHRVLTSGVLLSGDRPLEETRSRSEHPLHRRRRQQPALLRRDRQFQPLRRPPGRHAPQVRQELQRRRRTEVVPANRLLIQESREVPQIVGVGADRVRAVVGVGQVRQEPSDRHYLDARVIEQRHPADDTVLTMPDHLHTGLPRRCPLHQTAAPTVGRPAARRVQITENSAIIPRTLNSSRPTGS